MEVKSGVINFDTPKDMRRTVVLLYYESRKGELNIRLMNEGRYDERLKDRVEESQATFLTHTGYHDKTN